MQHRLFQRQRATRGVLGLAVCLAICQAARLAVILAVGAGAAVAAPERAAALLAEHAAMQARLVDSPFGAPLLLQAEGDPSVHSGVVMAVLPRPLGNVAAALRSAATVCGMLVLHLNVRGCRPAPDSGKQHLLVTAGPMRASTPGPDLPLVVALLQAVDLPGFFSARLTAPAGILGSSELQMDLEAVALPSGETYLHIRYRQTSGLAARLAARLYLATAGQGKVGFSSAAAGPDGVARLVGGEQGALERNVMRHYLALLASSTAAAGTPAQQLEARLRAWHALTERHAPQLHEIDLADYLTAKRAAVDALR